MTSIARRFLPLLLLLPSAHAGPAQEPVTLKTEDGIALAASFHRTEPDAKAPRAPAVLLVHGEGRDRKDWAGLIPVLLKSGFHVLSFDLRGHGESRLPDGQPVTILVPDAIRDAMAALAWLKAQPDVDPSRVSLVGAGQGAILALFAAAQDRDALCVTLLSPPPPDDRADYTTAAAAYDVRPMRIAVTAKEKPAADSLKALFKNAKPEIAVYPAKAGGTGILAAKDAPSHLVSWIRKQKPKTPFKEGAPAVPTPPSSDHPIVEIETTLGKIVVELFPQDAPKTVENFLTLVRKGFYDGIIFHRVIPDFMVQTGDPTGTGRGGPGYKIPDEFSKKRRHDRAGVLSMANSGPNTGGSQFFITHKATPWLDDKHAIFGQVIEGQDVVDKMAQQPRDAGDRPTKEIKMIKLTERKP